MLGFADVTQKYQLAVILHRIFKQQSPTQHQAIACLNIKNPNLTKMNQQINKSKQIESLKEKTNMHKAEQQTLAPQPKSNAAENIILITRGC